MIPPARDEAGFAGGLAGLLFGVLIFLFGTLLVAYGWAVVQTKAAVVDAARQAARTYVEAPGSLHAYESARGAAFASLAAKGRNPEHAALRIATGGFGRCERVTVTVIYPAPVVVLPLGNLLGGSAVKAEHSEIIDPYRSGLPGSASCG